MEDSILLRNLQDKPKSDENTEKIENSEQNIVKPKALRIEKKGHINNILKYDPNINYYEEYWKMICDNEYLSAQIKETMLEIESMKAHIQQLSNT